MKKSKKKIESKRLKEVLKDVISQKSLKKGIEKVRVCNSWEEVMGENIKKYTVQVRFSHSILYVNLRSAALKMELKYKLELIKDRLNLHLGEEIVKKVVLN